MNLFYFVNSGKSSSREPFTTFSTIGRLTNEFPIQVPSVKKALEYISLQSVPCHNLSVFFMFDISSFHEKRQFDLIRCIFDMSCSRIFMYFSVIIMVFKINGNKTT